MACHIGGAEHSVTVSQGSFGEPWRDQRGGPCGITGAYTAAAFNFSASCYVIRRCSLLCVRPA
jgi:hypothetical protein